MFLGFLAGGWNGYKVAMTTLKMNEQEEKKRGSGGTQGAEGRAASAGAQAEAEEPRKET